MLCGHAGAGGGAAVSDNRGAGGASGGDRYDQSPVFGMDDHDSESHIRDRIEAALASADVTTNEVIGAVAEIMRSGVGDLVNEKSGQLTTLEEMRDSGVDGLVREVVVKRTLEPADHGIDECKVLVETVKVKMHDRLTALLQILKIMGIEQAPMSNQHDHRRQIKLLAHALRRMLQAAADSGDQVTVLEAWDWLVKQEAEVFGESVEAIQALKGEVLAAIGIDLDPADVQVSD